MLMAAEAASVLVAVRIGLGGIVMVHAVYGTYYCTYLDTVYDVLADENLQEEKWREQ